MSVFSQGMYQTLIGGYGDIGIAESQGYSTIGVWYIGYSYRAADAITLYPRNFSKVIPEGSYFIKNRIILTKP